MSWERLAVRFLLRKLITYFQNQILTYAFYVFIEGSKTKTDTNSAIFSADLYISVFPSANSIFQAINKSVRFEVTQSYPNLYNLYKYCIDEGDWVTLVNFGQLEEIMNRSWPIYQGKNLYQICSRKANFWQTLNMFYQLWYFPKYQNQLTAATIDFNPLCDT